MATVVVNVALAIIEKDQTYLIAKRLANAHLPNLWEFPGGKQHAEDGPLPHETLEECVIREALEELCVEIKINRFYGKIEYAYPDRTVWLHAYLCRIIDGMISSPQEIKWVSAKELVLFPFPEANLPLILALSEGRAFLMKQYKALIFDLCDTIIPYQNDRKPTAMIRGEEIYTTTPLLYDCFRADHTNISYLEFYDHFISATESVLDLRASGDEVLASVRFDLFLDRLKIAPSNHRRSLHQNLLDIHFKQVSDCLICPQINRDLLIQLKEKYPIGLITNFDDTDTVYSILHRENIHGIFNTILISSEFGLRKPRKEIFLAACKNLAISPADALFIGDSLTSDIAGAKGVGMDAAWINPEGISVSQDVPQPDYILSNLNDLKGIL